MYDNKLIYGRNSTENIVSCEPVENGLILFREVDGQVIAETVKNKYWILTNKHLNDKQIKLDGDQYYKYLRIYDTFEQKEVGRKLLRKNYIDNYHIYDAKEASLLYNGITYYKGMTPKEVSILSFDIESTGLVHDEKSKVVLISNTFRKGGQIVKKLFAYDEYENDADMFDAWSMWVQELNPSILCGHNIFGYDLPYMVFCAKKVGTTLNLGRDGSAIRFNDYTSKKRKDGSQDIEYYNAHVYGREIVDTMFLAITYDVGRKYESYGLKPIIKHEGLEKIDRVFYDAGEIRHNYKNPIEWPKIKAYAMDDADDALALFDLMIPAYFYFAQSVSKTFQQMINSATGAQINNIMVRSYFQDGNSIARADEAEPFEGGISMGIPGIYKNALKWDLASAYPHTIIQFNLYDKRKDPQAYFLEICRYFTANRIKNKKLAKETGERRYKELEQAQKIIINSLFGFCGTPGLQYNAPHIASEITRRCRGYIMDSIKWATNETLEYWKNKCNSEIV